MAGTRFDQMALRMPALAAQSPTVIVVQGGANEIQQGTPLASMRAGLDSLFAQAIAVTARVICVNSIGLGEQFPDPLAATINAYNDVITQACRAWGVELANAYQLKSDYERKNNTPAPGTVIAALTTDRIHPTTAGKILMGDSVLAACRINRSVTLPTRKYWFRGDNIDGSNNATLTDGVSRPLNWTNLGSVGGNATASGAGTAALFRAVGTTGKLNDKPALYFDGARVYHTAAGSDIAQPSMIAVLASLDSYGGGTQVYCDGQSSGKRQQISWGAGVGWQPYAGSGAAGGTYGGVGALVGGAAALIIAYILDGAIQVWANRYVETMTGVSGTHVLAGVSLGGEHADLNKMTGKFWEYAMWGGGGTVPTNPTDVNRMVADIYKDFQDRYGVGITGEQ